MENTRAHGKDLALALHAQLTTPYPELVTLFENLPFIPSEERAERGGVLRPGVACKIERSNNVQMTFSKQQRRYAAVSLSVLTSLADGIVLGIPDPTPPLEQAIAATYRKNSGNVSYRFVDALRDGFTTGILDVFQSKHPNLIPALYGMFRIAGAEGVETALAKSEDALIKVYKGELTAENRQQYKKDRLPPRHFWRLHWSDLGDDLNAFEVHCTGSSFADTLVDKAVDAAFLISQKEPDVNMTTLESWKKYTVEGERMDLHLQEHVGRLAALTAEQFSLQTNTNETKA